MNNSDVDDLKYFDKRIKEFDKLILHVKSQTLIDLIKKAKLDTEKSIEKLIGIQKAIIVYLETYEIKNDQRLGDFQKQIDLQLAEVRKLKESNIEPALKDQFLQFHKTIADKVNGGLIQREELRKLTYKVFTSCADDFRTTLLEKIFKPNNGKFHYESIIDILNYVAGKIVPFLDEGKTLSNFPVAVRKKQFAKHGDKILIYLEQYIDAIDKWNKLGDMFIESTLD